jgi:hypothetical protein
MSYSRVEDWIRQRVIGWDQRHIVRYDADLEATEDEGPLEVAKRVE